MNLLVIHEDTLTAEKDHEHIIIGVAESIEMAEDMIKEYYGEGQYEEISKTDIRDSNLEYSKVLRILAWPGHDEYHVQITLEWFKLNEL